MARKTQNEIAVGLTVLIVLALTVYVVIALGDWAGAMAPKKSITVRLPYRTGLQGLNEGSPIYLGGTKIGKVVLTDIQPASADEESTQVWVSFTMRIPDAYPLREDCRLAADSNLLGGQVSLVIDDLGSDGPLLKDGQTVALELQGGLTQVMNDLQETLRFEFDRNNDRSLLSVLVTTADNLKTVTEKIDRQITGPEEKENLMAKVHEVLDKLNHIMDDVGGQFSPRAEHSMITRLNLALDTLNNSLSEIDALVTDNKDDIHAAVASIKSAAERIEADLPPLLDSLQGGTAAFQETMQGVRDIVVVNRDQIGSAIANFQQISSNIKLASEEIRRAPWRLIYKPSEDEQALQNVVNAAGAFAVAAERLDNASARMQLALQAVSADIPIDSSTLQGLLGELESSFSRFRHAEEVFWNELK